jgi:hypothetical protein
MSRNKWMPITGDQAKAIRDALGDLLVNGYGQLTDLTGQYGDPKIMDTWGINGSDLPLLQAVTRLGGPRSADGCYFERIETKWHVAVYMEEND